MLPEADRVRLQHMLDAARQAMEFAAGCTRDDLDIDAMRARALVQCLAVVGEAAARVDEEARSKHPVIPWRKIVGVRNRLVHAYFDIDHDQIWRMVTEDLPTLAEHLQQILQENG